MPEDPPRREHVTETPLVDEGVFYARLAPGPHRNLVYLLADPESQDAVVVDPAFDVPRIVAVLEHWGVRLRAALFTHNHWDHIEGAEAVQQATGCTFHIHEADAPLLQEKGLDVIPHADGARIAFGAHEAVAHHTPGHTAGGTTYQVGRRLFTGDVLFIGQAGRTDFPTGSKRAMWDTLQRLKADFDDTHILCPGHDYGDVPEADLGDQKRRNPALLHSDYAAFEKEWYLVAY